MKTFEWEILKKLIQGTEIENCLPVSVHGQGHLEYTEVGYFLTLYSDRLPKKQLVLSQPNIVGRLGDRLVGYIAFVANSTLTLECFTYGSKDLSPVHREMGFEST